MLLIGISAFVILEMALVSANHPSHHTGGPYPPKGWKPNGPKFETPETSVPPVVSEHSSTPPPVSPSSQTPFKEYGPPHNKPILQTEHTTIKAEVPITEPSSNSEDVEIVNELNELNRKRRQKSAKLEDVEEFDVTTNPSLTIEKKEDLSPTTRDMGTYYIYHPNGVLQKIVYSTKNDRINMEFIARLKYENVISIEDPLYTYDPSLNKFVSRLNDKNWTTFDNCQDIKLLADKLVSNYASLIETCFPLQRQNSDKQPVKWFNEDLRRMRDTLRSIKIIYNVTKNTSDKLVYEKFKKKYREAIQHTKKLRYDNFITCSHNKSKASWRLVNYELKRNIKDTHSNLDVNLVNRYFSTVAANILSSLPPNKVDTSNYLNFVNKPNVTFFLSPVTESEVTETINNLSSSECPDAFGLHIDSALSWSSHIEYLCKKISSQLFLLRQLKRFSNINTLLSVYYSLIQSQISYGILLWGNSSNSFLIFRLQKKALRIMAGVGPREHCISLFLKYNIMTVTNLYLYHSLQFIHNNIGSYVTNSIIHNYNTRNAKLLRPPRHHFYMTEKTQ
nr:unnamed protein product [Callosobruchus analis]